LCFPVKPEAIESSQKLWQASAVNVNLCYLNRFSPYVEDLKE